MSKNNTKNTIENHNLVEIETLAPGGKGLSRKYGPAVIVDGALPGQIAEIVVKKKRRNYVEAKAIRIVRRSSDETTPPYQDTPGAPWLRLPPEKQRVHKFNLTADLFEQIANTDIRPVFEDYIESPIIFGYRNKMDYSFGYTEEAYDKTRNVYSRSGFGLGSRQRGSFILVENLHRPSGLFDVEFEKNIPKIRDFLIQTGLPPYDTKRNTGFYRQLAVRKSFYENAFYIDMLTHSDYSAQFSDDDFYGFLTTLFGKRLNGYQRRNHDGVSDALTEKAIPVYKNGVIGVTEKINGLSFYISALSFFQTNPLAAEKLYKKVAAYCDIQDETSIILDLFCGTGTIAQILAQMHPDAEIIGAELSSEAIRDAEANARNNKLSHIKFVNADVKHFLSEFQAQNKSVTAVLDPPRSGISPKPLKALLNFNPGTIVYVSCNPASLARDALLIKDSGYKLEKISFVDQFPHTPHVECVAKFSRA